MLTTAWSAMAAKRTRLFVGGGDLKVQLGGAAGAVAALGVAGQAGGGAGGVAALLRHAVGGLGIGRAIGRGLKSPAPRSSSVDPPPFWWTPMLAFRSWRGVSDECSTPELPGFFQA